MLCKNPQSVFDFTASCVHHSKDSICDSLKIHCKKWSFQKERGEDGYEHFQGRVSLKAKSRTPQKLSGFDKMNWSVTSNENSTNDFYVTFEETRIEGPWRDTDVSLYVPRQIRDIAKLRPFQEHIINDAKIWDTRTINIVIDTQGCNGKSTLKTYIGCHGIGRALPFTNDYKDICRMVMDTPKVPLYIIDIPRALKKEYMFNFFSGIETLKDGYAYDDRYHFREEYFDCPNIWVFTNVVPELEMLSKDRWKFWRINEQMELVDYNESELVFDDPPAI